MKFNIKMPTHDSLCAKCKWSTMIERKTGHVAVYCGEIGYGVTVPPDVTRCNSYAELGANSEHDYKEIAWIIKSDKSGKILGFRAPAPKKSEY